MRHERSSAMSAGARPLPLERCVEHELELPLRVGAGELHALPSKEPRAKACAGRKKVR